MAGASPEAAAACSGPRGVGVGVGVAATLALVAVLLRRDLGCFLPLCGAADSRHMQPRRMRRRMRLE